MLPPPPFPASFRRHVPTKFLINQCQIITFLILKSDNIENSRIDLKGKILQAPSNQIKVTFIIIIPFNLVHLCVCFFFLFHIEIDGKYRWIMGGRGKGYVAPPLRCFFFFWGGGGRGLPPPLSPCSPPFFLRLWILLMMVNN